METPKSEHTNREENPMAHHTSILRSRMRLARSIAVLGLLGLALLTACHTTAGFGQDMQSVGRNIQNSANKNNK
jgi:predicted small secreted protein